MKIVLSVGLTARDNRSFFGQAEYIRQELELTRIGTRRLGSDEIVFRNSDVINLNIYPLAVAEEFDNNRLGEELKEEGASVNIPKKKRPSRSARNRSKK